MDYHVQKVEQLFAASRMFLKILTTFTFIIVYMKMFGRKMIEDGKKEFQLMKFLGLLIKIINVFLLVMHQ